MTTSDADLLEGLVVPHAAQPCRRCGHAHQAHGQDPRDTSCTECTCIEWAEPQEVPTR